MDESSGLELILGVGGPQLPVPGCCSGSFTPAHLSRPPLLSTQVFLSGYPKVLQWGSTASCIRAYIFKSASYCRGIGAFVVAPRGCQGPLLAYHLLLSSFPHFSSWQSSGSVGTHVPVAPSW